MVFDEERRIDYITETFSDLINILLVPPCHVNLVAYKVEQLLYHIGKSRVVTHPLVLDELGEMKDLLCLMDRYSWMPAAEAAQMRSDVVVAADSYAYTLNIYRQQQQEQD